jgi:hypothetical protein
MKHWKKLLMGVFVVGALSSCSKDKGNVKQAGISVLGNSEMNSERRFTIKIKIRTGTPNSVPPRDNCFGKGACGPCPGLCIVVGLDGSAGLADATADVALVGLTQMRIDFNSPPDDNSGLFPIQLPVVLPLDVAQALGRTAITIIPGVYPLDFSSNVNGAVTVNIVAI